jgi:hypothetical protein
VRLQPRADDQARKSRQAARSCVEMMLSTLTVPLITPRFEPAGAGPSSITL